MTLEVFRLLGTIAVKNDEANKKIEDTKKKAEGLSGTFSKIGEATIKFGNTMTKGVAVVGAAWAASVEGSREYRTEMGKLNAAFTTSGHTTKTASDAYRTLYGVIGQTDQAVEAAQQIALLADAEKDVAEWAGLAAGVTGRFGDALMPETFFEAANETIKLGEATGAYVQMLEGVGMSVNGFNAGLAACNTEAEKQAYMLSVTRSALGDASKAYNENNKDIIEANKAQGDLTDSLAKIGEYTEPTMTKLKESITSMVETALPYLKSFMEWTIENGKATAIAISTIATSMAVAAVAAHPYAAAIMAVAAGLAMLSSAPSDPYTKAFAGFSGQDLQVMQDYVDAMNAVRKAEAAYLEDSSSANYDAYQSAVNMEQMAKEKATAIEGLISAYNTWHSGQANYMQDGLYLDVPLKVADDSESNMQSELDGMKLDSTVKLLPDASAIDAALSYTRQLNVALNTSGMYTAGEVPGSSASGIERVHRDGYLTRVHKDEAILNAAQASAWRGGSDRIEMILSRIENLLSAGQVIQLDSGIMAGQLTPAIDTQLGAIQGRKGRGN